jgi:hypothetical protein
LSVGLSCAAAGTASSAKAAAVQQIRFFMTVLPGSNANCQNALESASSLIQESSVRASTRKAKPPVSFLAT